MSENRYYFTDTETEFIKRLPVPMAVFQYYEGFYHVIAVTEVMQELMHWSDMKWESLISLEIPLEFTTRIGGSEHQLEGQQFHIERADSLLWYVVYSDVTKQNKRIRRQRAKLHFRQDFMNRILDTCQDCVFWKDADRRFMGVNRAFLKAYGLESADALIGKTDEEMGWHTDPEPFRLDEERVLREGITTNLVPGRCIIRGRERSILASKAPLYENGRIVGLVGSFVDVTEREEALEVNVQLSEEREIALLEAEQARETMSQFIMRASHEMRTPLNAILGFTQLAQGVNDIDLLVDYMDKISVSGKILTDLVNDILDIRKIDEGSMEINPRPMILSELLSDLDGMVGVLATNKSIAYYTDVEGFEHEYIMADRVRLQQIMMNLLNNAVKFTDAGGTVYFGVKEDQVRENFSEFTFTVRDTGCGMSDEFIGRIFEPFAQENRNASKYGSGTGLGLTITKRMIELMHGSITVDTKEGEGSVFTVKLPLTLCDQSEYDDVEAHDFPSDDVFSLKGRRMLVVEDNFINQQVIEGMLATDDIRVDIANNGLEAVEMFGSSETGYYEAVLMDIFMPEMNGYEATAAIRALDRRDAQSVPILAMSAEVAEEAIQRGRAAGMNEYISKPIDMSRLRSILRRYLNRH